MTNFVNAFFCVFCLMSIGIISLAIGLSLIDPLLGLLALISCVAGMYSTSGNIE